MRVALVGCSKMKLDRPAPARELYTSAAFRMSLGYAVREVAPHGRVFILSALHGLLDTERVVAPYDFTMREVVDVGAWAEGVCAELADLVGPVELVIFAGRAYADPIGRVLAGRRGWSVVEPLRGLTQGPRLRFLARFGV